MGIHKGLLLPVSKQYAAYRFRWLDKISLNGDIHVHTNVHM